MSLIIPLPQKSDNSLSTFQFEQNVIRVVADENGDPLFVAADVCKVLGLDQVSRAVSRLDDDEKGVTTITTPGGPQQLAVVNESGLYNLILTSRKPEAKTFKRWISHEVLPSIRKTGQYAVEPAKPPSALDIVENMVKALRAHEDRLARIEARQDTLDEKGAYFTVYGYATYIGRHIDHGTGTQLGKRATSLSKSRNIHIGKTKDPRYGYVNNYHESILKDVFDNWYSQFPLLED